MPFVYLSLLLPLFVCCGEASMLRSLPDRGSLAFASDKAANSSVALGGIAAAANASHNSSQGRYPFSARAAPAVGKVFSLYYSSFSGAQATSVEAGTQYGPAKQNRNVWNGGQLLPEPTCALQLKSKMRFASDRRQANLRLAELAICQLFADRGQSVPSCGASGEQVCELEVFAPIPSSDEMQEPYIAAAMALAAYSQLCALGQSSQYDAYKCEIRRSMSAVCAGLRFSGGQVELSGLPIPGLLDLKLEDAYVLNLESVYLADESVGVYHETKHYNDLGNTLAWQHAPPKATFCRDLSCLATAFIN